MSRRLEQADWQDKLKRLLKGKLSSDLEALRDMEFDLKTRFLPKPKPQRWLQ